MVSSIRREIHALSKIRHPGIVRILDEGLDRGLPWYAMELLVGRTLRRSWLEGLAQTPTASQAPVGESTAPTDPRDVDAAWWTRQPGSPSPHPLPAWEAEGQTAASQPATVQPESVEGRRHDPGPARIRLPAGEPAPASGETLLHHLEDSVQSDSDAAQST